MKKALEFTLDRDIDTAFIVHDTMNGDKRFIWSKNGLHYYNANMLSKQTFIMTQTVNDNKALFNKRELKRANDAMKLYEAVRRPGYKSFYDMLQQSLIKNYNITAQDAKNVFRIYGPDEGAIRGKTTRSTPKKVITQDLYQLPKDFYNKYRYVTIAIEIFFFDLTPYLLKISRDIHFCTVEKLENRENGTILESIKKVISMNNTRGFVVKFILADGEFRHMTHTVLVDLKYHLNCTAAGEHVPEAECAIRVIKERLRSIITTWPFKSVPTVFKVRMIKFIIFWLNSIPQANSIIPNTCSRAIVVGKHHDYEKHYKTTFGSYVHVHKPKAITNTMLSRTLPVIALGSIPTLQGSYRLYCLDTQRIITRR